MSNNDANITPSIPFRRATIDDKALFERLVIDSQCRNCDMSFANIFCWQESYHSQVALYNEFLLIRFTTDRGESAYMQPIGSGDKRPIIEALAADAALLTEPLRLFGLNEEWREFLAENYPDTFAFCNPAAHNDYIYLASDLATLLGRKYQPKRNHINRFVSRYSYRFEPINGDNIEDCRYLNQVWCNNKGSQCEIAEQRAISRALDNFSLLPLEGWILYADNTPCAYSIGSAVNYDTFCIHIEKVDTTFEGAGAMVNNLVAVELQQRFKYINREDDLGIEGLRRAKQSYHPIELLAKYSALQLTTLEQQMIGLWSDVFGDQREFIEQFMVQLYNPELCLTHIEEDRLTSMLHIVPLDSGDDTSAYIYAVATHPDYRGRGYASALIQRAIDYIQKAGIYSRIILVPSSDKAATFYTKFGFEQTDILLDQFCINIDFDLGSGEAERDFVMMKKIY